MILALAFAFTCARGVQQEPVRPGQNTKIVARTVVITGEEKFKATGYWRIEDQPQWPPQLVLAVDGTACPLWKMMVHEPREREYFRCPVSWRIRRFDD